MVEEATKFIRIDLNQFKLNLHLKPEVELTLHFDSPSRRFYLSLIGLVVHEMKKLGRITSIPLQKHLDVLALLNKTVGMAAGSSKTEHLLPRIYRKWKDALPDLENAPLFKVVGRKKRYDELMEKVYGFGEVEKDSWANLFEYKGSNENVRLRFSIDRLNASLDDVIIVYGESPGLANGDAWESFVSDLKEKLEEKSNPRGANGEFGESELPILQRGVQISAIYRRWKWLALCALIGLVVGVAALAGWENNLFFPPVKIGSVEKVTIPLPDKPSIAVLPFDNLSGDPEQEYFSDGITDDLITALSKISGIFVISRNSVFTFKGKPVKIQQVANDLNVQYVLEGSIRRAGDTIRINAELIDANSDHHLWAEKYDGRIDDVFRLQDNITRKIVSALSVKLTNKEELLFSKVQTHNIEAYYLFLKGRNLSIQHKPESYAEAAKLLKKAVELDPNFSQAYAELARIYWYAAGYGPKFWKELGIGYFSGRYLAISYLELAMQNPTPLAYQIAVEVAGARRQFKTMAEEAQKAFELSPNASESYFALSLIYRETQPEESLSFAKMEAKLDPLSLHWSLYRQGIAYFFMKDFEKTVEFMNRVGDYEPDLLQGNPYLVAALAYLGRDEEAKRVYKNQYLKAFEPMPPPIPEHIIHVHYYQTPEMADLLINGLIKAGLPAQPNSYCRLSEDEKLSIEEVKKLAFDKTWTGYFWYAPKVQFWYQWSKNDRYTFKSGETVLKREAIFEGDKLYVLMDAGVRKVKAYINIYRNPHGSYERKNEYIIQHEAAAWPFSVENKS